MKALLLNIHRYMPIAISAYSTAYFALLFFVDYTPAELKDLAIASFFLSGLGWITVFMVEEDIRKLVVAVHNTLVMINRMLEEEIEEEIN